MRRLSAALVLLVGACQPEPPQVSLRVEVAVTTDPARPLSGVTVRVGAASIGRTDAQGIVRSTLTGRAGQRVRLGVDCPPDARPAAPRTLVLRPSAATHQGGARRLELRCLPRLRSAVVVVRAPGAEGLPLFADGQPVGRVGPDGTAHVELRRAPGSEIRLALDTSAAPQLRPRSPAQQLVVEDRDALWIFDQTLTEERSQRRRRAGRGPRSRPHRIERLR